MAVRHFATNNLVEGHDNYVKFMKKRAEYFKDKGLENNDILFFKKGIVCEAFGIATTYGNAGLNKYDRDITLWHCITLAYDIWSKYACKYIDTKRGSSVPYKLFVDIPEEVLDKIKIEFNQAIANAKCDYAKYTNRCADLTICRYLARFWTYLDIVKDTTTQRYLPNKDTCFRATSVFGYEPGDNPFIMNGKFLYSARRNNGDEPMVKEVTKSMEEKKVTYSLDLDTPLKDIGLSVRSFNALWRAGYHTLGDIINLKYENLIKVRNLGLHSTKEILEKINELQTVEESVIDIAEQAAEEVEEEPIDTDPKLTLEAHMRLIKDYDNLKNMYDTLLRNSKELARQNDDNLKGKMDAESYCLRLKSENEELKERNSNLSIVANPKNLDTFALLNTILEKMKDSKMDSLFLTINGITVDIHPAKSFPLRTSYQIRSSEG